METAVTAAILVALAAARVALVVLPLPLAAALPPMVLPALTVKKPTTCRLL